MKSDEVLYFSSPLVSLTTKYFLNDLINKKQILPKVKYLKMKSFLKRS